ncbi:unnamed protein product [Pedinophyceae sp. YPF-701]|nr:unnamed protein product [Pedinophyceae sp. YPF-701]
MNEWERHQKRLDEYFRYYGGARKEVPAEGLPAPASTDLDLIRDTFRFIREDGDDDGTQASRMARRYYDRLHKEYCLADLSRYRTGQVGMRWRVDAEVMRGKGQIECGAVGCSERAGLATFEVNFAYVEAGEGKQALVKLVVCPECAYKLHYKKIKGLKEGLRERAGSREARSEKKSRSKDKKSKREKGRKRSRSRSRERSARRRRRSPSSSSSGSGRSR